MAYHEHVDFGFCDGDETVVLETPLLVLAHQDAVDGRPVGGPATILFYQKVLNLLVFHFCSQADHLLKYQPWSLKLKKARKKLLLPLAITIQGWINFPKRFTEHSKIAF